MIFFNIDKSPNQLFALNLYQKYINIMNKLFHSVAIIFFIACSSDNEGLDPHLIAPELAITELSAKGSVAEQTVA